MKNPLGCDMPNFLLKSILEMGKSADMDGPQQTYVLIIKLSAQDRADNTPVTPSISGAARSTLRVR